MKLYWLSLLSALLFSLVVTAKEDNLEQTAIPFRLSEVGVQYTPELGSEFEVKVNSKELIELLSLQKYNLKTRDILNDVAFPLEKNTTEGIVSLEIVVGEQVYPVFENGTLKGFLGKDARKLLKQSRRKPKVSSQWLFKGLTTLALGYIILRAGSALLETKSIDLTLVEIKDAVVDEILFVWDMFYELFEGIRKLIFK